MKKTANKRKHKFGINAIITNFGFVKISSTVPPFYRVCCTRNLHIRTYPSDGYNSKINLMVSKMTCIHPVIMSHVIGPDGVCTQ